jgi:hypothetical protein
MIKLSSNGISRINNEMKCKQLKTDLTNTQAEVLNLLSIIKQFETYLHSKILNSFSNANPDSAQINNSNFKEEMYLLK